MPRPSRIAYAASEAFLSHERAAHAAGYRSVAGIDEAGRGPLAGPVVAAAVILSADRLIPGVFDAKLLSPKARQRAAAQIRGEAAAIGVGIVEAEEIDRTDIRQATLKAMRLAVSRLSPPPDFLLIDGRDPIGLPSPFQCIVKGDRLSLSIAAASVIAKVTRDEMMILYDERFPHYGFRRNKGYGTLEHRRAIARWGPCPIHRKTFRGVREHLSPHER